MKNWKLIEFTRAHPMGPKYRYEIQSEGKTVCSLGSNKEDAMLIAQAPAMHEALGSLLDAIDSVDGDLIPTHVNNALNEAYTKALKLFDAVTTGGTPPTPAISGKE